MYSTINYPWKKLYHFTCPSNLPQFHPLFQGFFIIIGLCHSLPRYCMLWLNTLVDSVSTPLWMKSVGVYCRGDGWNRCSFHIPSRLTREYFFFYFYYTDLFVDFRLRTMYELSVGEDNHSLGFIFCWFVLCLLFNLFEFLFTSVSIK